MSYKYEFFPYVVMRFLLAREYLLLPERMRQCCNKLNLLVCETTERTTANVTHDGALFGLGSVPKLNLSVYRNFKL